MFAQALEIDPNYSRALAGIALSYNRDLMLGHASSREAAAETALKNARKAVALDRSDAFARSVLGMAHLWCGQQEEARLSFQRSVELIQSNGYARASLGNVLDLMGQSEEGIAMLEDGIRLNPDAPNMRHVFGFLARALICAHRYDRAVEWARRGTNTDRENPNAQYLLAAALAISTHQGSGSGAFPMRTYKAGFRCRPRRLASLQDSSRNEPSWTVSAKCGGRPKRARAFHILTEAYPA